MARLSIALIVLALLGCSDEAPRGDAPRVGLWVLAEGSHRTLDDPERIETLIRDARRLRATDLFVQVYRGGRSWFPSQAADDAPYRQIRETHGLEPLTDLLEQAHAHGLRVHAWFNALSLARNRDAPILRELGADAVLVDRRGRSLLDYPDLEVPEPDRAYLRMGTPHLWLDPAVRGVPEYLEQTVDDLLRAAPELDGLHLDFIRHPLALPLVPGSRFDVGLDFGYGAGPRERFEEQVGKPFRRGQSWDAFRRTSVGELVRRLCARIGSERACSAAVLPWADRAYMTAMQDYRHWLEEGWLDFAVAMAYTRDDHLLRYVARGLTGGVAGDRIWIGLGTWLFIEEVERARRQIELVRASPAPGIVLFSYDALAGAPEALRGLHDAVARETR